MRHIRTPVALLAAAALVVTTVAACSAPHDGADIQQQDQSSQERIDPAADVSTVKPTADDPAAQPQTKTTQTADELFDEQMRWCKAWALDNLEPLAYVEFLELDPSDMDDIDRSIWHNRLREANLTCAMYWREPLSKQNAHLSNVNYRTLCLKSLTESADQLWSRFAAVAADPLRDREDNPAYDVPNQYVRILRWVHLTGDELLAMDERPHQLLERLARHRYDRVELEHPSAVSHFAGARSYYGEDFFPEWWGLEAAVREVIGPCGSFRPQVFTGHWTPQAYKPTAEEPAIPDHLADDVKRLLNGSLYLPRP